MMEGAKKKRKKNCSSNSGTDDSEDRISSLPDNLITHILSFLEIKQVIKTSLLATRWRSLWTTIPVLDFGSWWTARSNTATLINLFLLHYTGQKIRKFRAHVYGKVDACHFNSWTRFATTHGIEELDIWFSLCNKIPRFSNYGELKVLKLEYCALDLHASDHFSSLKELHLSEVEFIDLNTSGCPLLEKLIMKGCRNRRNIYAPNEKLRYLKDTVGYQKEGENDELAVYAPHLLCIEFGLGFRRSYNLKNVSSVKSVIFRPVYISEYDNGAEVMVELMKSLSHAETLKLSMDSIKLLTRANYLRMPYLSASSLEVEISLEYKHELSMIASLLNKIRCLETLIIKIQWEGFHHDYVDDLDNVMWDLERTEMKLVEVLLKGCKALEKLVIRGTMTTCLPSIYSKLLPALMGKPLALPRGSPNAGIHFFWNMRI